MARSKEFNESEVLKKAMHLFWHKGFSETSAQDLVEGLGIHRSSLYSTFGDKFELFKKALGLYRKEYSQPAIQMLEEAENPKSTLIKLFDVIVQEALEDSKAKGCFMVNVEIEMAPHCPEVSSAIQANRKEFEMAWYHFIQRGQSMGQFKKDASALAMARFVFGIITALRVASRSNTPKEVLDDTVQIALKAILEDNRQSPRTL